MKEYTVVLAIPDWYAQLNYVKSILDMALEEYDIVVVEMEES